MKRMPIRITFKDRDGNLIMNRECDAYWYSDYEELMVSSLAIDARERGVRIISADYKYSCRRLIHPKAGGTINCLVEYLKRSK